MDSLNDRAAVRALQLAKLRAMLAAVLAENRFYARKIGRRHEIATLDDLAALPFTTKTELVEDQQRHPPFGSDLTFPLERYIRVHQTSGTTGKPLYWLDTEASWEWWAECWKTIFHAAGASAADRIYFAFSFGPFIGFWAGWEGARKLGALALSGGGQSTAQRLRAIVDCGATILVCTPTYALHMAAEAKKLDIDLPRQVPIRASIHAGEPGASIPSTKKRIEEAWGGRCFDHPGATEVGAFGFECELQPGGVHVNEREFIAEVVDPKTGKPVVDDAEGELVMTNLGRIGSPVIRYRTGDVVRPSHEPCPCGRPYLFLRGGVLGRVDDMVVIRGVNVYPSAIERIVRQIQEIDEFRIEAVQTPGLTELKITAEPRPGCVTVTAIGAELSERIRSALGVRPVVEIVSPGALPRFELKARRFFKSARS